MIKNRLSETIILRLIVILPIIATIITAFLLTNIFIQSEKSFFEKEMEKSKKEQIVIIKNQIKDKINRTIDTIRAKHAINQENNQKKLKDMVNMGHAAIASLYVEYQAMNKEAILEEIKHHIRQIRFFENNIGYFYIYDMNGTTILHPQLPHTEGKSAINVQDINGKYITKEVLKSLENKDEAFNTWYWNKTANTPVKKLGFYKKFEPLNIFIGTGLYYDDMEQESINDTIRILNAIKYNTNDYIFAISDKGMTLVHYNQKFINKPFDQLSSRGKGIISSILNQRKFKNGNFIEYDMRSINDNSKTISKISFIKHIPELKMTIGTGIDTKHIEKAVLQQSNVLSNKLKTTVNTIILTAFVITLIIVLIMLLIANALRSILNNYAQALSTKNKDLKELNENLENKVERAIAKIRKQDDMMNQQAKMAAMGEMLGNISHQWRQPLSAISSSASGLKYESRNDLLTQEDLHKGLDAIVRNTKVLSQTIDDFRNFFNPNKELSKFNLKVCFEKLLVLVSANLDNKNIKLVQDIENVDIYSHQNELTQALLNIINNAKDALETLDENQKRLILIRVTASKNSIVITIKDSAGGIKEDILSRIFEPYFTTKHQSHGTGIGLYMTKKIIEKSLKGKIEITNTEFQYEEILYKGALCTIKLPKNI